jgi:putative redox protein
MEINVEYLGNAQFEAETRGHKLICDQPLANHGDDEGMTPPELLLASVATCAGYYAVEYLKARHLSTDGVRVRVTAEKALQPARMDRFKVRVDAPSATDPQHAEGVRRSAEKCLVKNTLMHPPSIEVLVNAPDPVSSGA